MCHPPWVRSHVGATVGVRARSETGRLDDRTVDQNSRGKRILYLSSPEGPGSSRVISRVRDLGLINLVETVTRRHGSRLTNGDTESKERTFHPVIITETLTPRVTYTHDSCLGSSVLRDPPPSHIRDGTDCVEVLPLFLSGDLGPEVERTGTYLSV